MSSASSFKALKVSGCILDIQPFKLPQAANIRLISLLKYFWITLEYQHMTTYDQLPCIRIRCTCRQKCKDKHGQTNAHRHQRPRPMTFSSFSSSGFPFAARLLPFLSLLRSNARVPLPSVPAGCLPPVAVSQICWTQTKKQILCPNVNQGSHSSTWTPALQVRDCSWHSTTLNPLES